MKTHFATMTFRPALTFLAVTAAITMSLAPAWGQGVKITPRERKPVPPIRLVNPNDPGILEPALSATTGTPVRIPHTDQASGQTQLNIQDGTVTDVDARGALSARGFPITRVESPNEDMKEALKDMSDAAKDGLTTEMRAAAQDLMNILLGTTQGRIYDGFAMLNFNRGAFMPDHVPGEYKMKTLRDTGLTEPGMDGQPRKIWEANVSLFYYDGQIDSDTFLLRVPVAAHEFDTVADSLPHLLAGARGVRAHRGAAGQAPAGQRAVPVQRFRRGLGADQWRPHHRVDREDAARAFAARSLYLGLAGSSPAHPIFAAGVRAGQCAHRGRGTGAGRTKLRLQKPRALHRRDR